MDGIPKKRAYTKSRLIKELAFRAGISQHQSRAALEAIIEIAYREAKANYFILPGLCKFDVVRREPRKVRNPITGEQLMLPARDALRVVLSKGAKEAVAPRVAPMKMAEYEALVAQQAAETKATEETNATDVIAEVETASAPVSAEVAAAAEAVEAAQAAEVAAAAEEVAETAEAVEAVQAAEAVEAVQAAEAAEVVQAEEVEQATETVAEVAESAEGAEVAAANQPTAEAPSVEAPAPVAEDDGFIDAPEVKGDRAISFKCTTCGQEIVAPEETIGYEAECPACGAILLVPAKSEPGTTYAPGGDGEKKEIISVQEVEELNPEALKTRTIRIDALLFDDEASKPAPPPSANAQKSKTMRIDLPDEF